MMDIKTTSPKISSLLVFIRAVFAEVCHPNFIELYLETSCLCPSEEHKHGGRKVTETSVTEFCY